MKNELKKIADKITGMINNPAPVQMTEMEKLADKISGMIADHTGDDLDIIEDETPESFAQLWPTQPKKT